jgi:hypothetical protein
MMECLRNRRKHVITTQWKNKAFWVRAPIPFPTGLLFRKFSWSQYGYTEIQERSMSKIILCIQERGNNLGNIGSATSHATSIIETIMIEIHDA